MKLLFAADFHGNGFAYRALLHFAKERRVDAVLLGGDLCPYAYRAENAVEEHRAFAAGDLAAHLRAFRKNSEIPIFSIPGNDDCAALEPEWRRFEDEGLWHWIPGRAVPLGDELHVAGLPYVPVTPFLMSDYDRIDEEGWRPSHCPQHLVLSDGGSVRLSGLEEITGRPTIADELASLAKRSEPAKTIYVMHSPPHDTALDRMQGGRPIGSQAIRDFIEKHQPPVTFHGHIHESYTRSGSIHEQLGRTLSLNPGPSLDRLRAVLVDGIGDTLTVEPVFA